MSRLSTLCLAGVSLALAACADSNKVTTPAVSPDGSASFDAGGVANPDIRHVMPTIQAQAAQNSKPVRGGGSGTGISYHGGSVLQSGTKVVSIYWSASTIYNGGPTPNSTGAGTSDGSLVGYFLNNLGGSPYFNINSTYTDGSGRNIVNAVSYVGFWANGSYNVPTAGQNVSDAQMLDMLQYGFNNGLIQYDPNTLYQIFTPGTVNLGGGFGSQYCAYHTHGSVNLTSSGTRTVLYSAMPYNYAYPSACSANLSTWANGDAGADAEVNTLAHEIEETTTDMMGNAWFDARGYENADKCAWQWGSLYPSGNANVTVGSKNFLVQMNWVNAGSGGCLNKY